MTVEDMVHPSISKVGVDLGIIRYLVLSSGNLPYDQRAYKESGPLGLLQRKLARQKKFSNNWQKTKEQVNRLHSHIGNIRNDFLHKLTTKLSNSHAVIFVEALKIRT